MANIMTALKAEIARIARREIRQVVVPLHKPVVATRHAVADLKRRVAALEKECKRLAALPSRMPQPVPKAEPAETSGWISGKGVRSLRQKLSPSPEVVRGRGFHSLARSTQHEGHRRQRQPAEAMEHGHADWEGA